MSAIEKLEKLIPELQKDENATYLCALVNGKDEFGLSYKMNHETVLYLVSTIVMEFNIDPDDVADTILQIIEIKKKAESRKKNKKILN